jgi:thiosulfate reductase cytochrome b subunit
MNSPLKAGRAVLLSLVVLVALAAPASAAGPAVLAAAKPWHYWISFVLAASFVGLVVMMVVGYLVRVIMLKYGIKVGRKST